MSAAVAIVINPANVQQRYVLWGDGHINNLGGALPIAQAEGDANTPDTYLGAVGTRQAPTFYVDPANSVYGVAIARRIWVTDWSGPSGYILTWRGKVFPFGAAADPPGGSNPLVPSGTQAVDMVVDPALPRGYILTDHAFVVAFGAGLGAISTGAIPFVGIGIWRRLLMDWATKKTGLVDCFGRIWSANGAPVFNVAGAGTPGTGPSGAALWVIDIGKTAVITDWVTGKGWYFSSWGHALAVNGAPNIYGNPWWPHTGWLNDVALVDDGHTGNPIEFVAVYFNGEMRDWQSVQPPVCIPGAPAGHPVDPTIDTVRPEISWSYTDPDGTAQKQYEIIVYPSAKWNAGGLVSEVQSLTITGAPTGGSIQLGLDNALTAAIAWNAAAAAVQAALVALPTIGAGNVVVTGGPLPGTPMTITFQGTLARLALPLLTVVPALTGGAAPAVVVAEVTKGTTPSLDMTVDQVASNGAALQTWGTDAGVRGITPGQDLPNDATGLRAFIRVTSSGLRNSGWRVVQWVQHVTPIATPTVTPTVVGGLGGISLLVHVPPAGLPVGTQLAVQYQDPWMTAGTWAHVRAGDALIPDGAGNATVVDLEAPFGVARSYRVSAYIPQPYRTSPWSATVPATLTPNNMFTLTDPTNPALGGKVRVKAPPDEKHQVESGIFFPVGRDNAVVVSSGAPKGPTITLRLDALDITARQLIGDLLKANDTLLLRDPFGRAWYARIRDTVNVLQILASPTPADVAAVRDAHEYTLILQTVDRPLTGPTANAGVSQLLGTLASAWIGPPTINNDAAVPLLVA